jgi:hypothetical protein
VIKQG